MKYIVISLINFNGKKNTLECLESLKILKKEDLKLTIIVIDNASAEPLSLSSGFVGDIPLVVIRNEKNLGFSGGHNVGIKYGLENGADYILTLNNDTFVDKNFLEELVSVAQKDKRVGIVVPKIYFAPGFEFHKDRYSKTELGKILWYAGGQMDWGNVLGHNRGVDLVDKGQFDRIEKSGIATGCCMLIKKEIFEKIGLFDEKYFLYYEDADLSMRVKKIGYEIIYVPKAIIWHKNAGSAGGSGSVLQDYYIARNRLLFGMLYAPFRSKLALIKESLSLLFYGREWQKKGVWDFYLGRFGKGSFQV